MVHLLIQLDHSQVVIGLEGGEEEDEEEHHGNHSSTPKYFLLFLLNLQDIRHIWIGHDKQLIKSSHPILFTTVTALATSAKECSYNQKDEAMSTLQDKKTTKNYCSLADRVGTGRGVSAKRAGLIQPTEVAFFIAAEFKHDHLFQTLSIVSHDESHLANAVQVQILPVQSIHQSKPLKSKSSFHDFHDLRTQCGTAGGLNLIWFSKMFLCFSLRAVARVTDGKVGAGEGEARVQQNVALFLFAPKLWP